jgi:hypothetical protein
MALLGSELRDSMDAPSKRICSALIPRSQAQVIHPHDGPNRFVTCDLQIHRMIQSNPSHHANWLVPFMAALTMLLSGCAAVPIQAISDARQAIDAATQAGGDLKAAQQMQDARSAMAQAETALKKVQYKRARELAQEARAKAIEAQRASEQ